MPSDVVAVVDRLFPEAVANPAAPLTLTGEPAQARQILRKLLEGRVVMKPRIDNTGRFYDWSVNATYGRLLAGVVGVTMMVPPG